MDLPSIDVTQFFRRKVAHKHLLAFRWSECLNRLLVCQIVPVHTLPHDKEAPGDIVQVPLLFYISYNARQSSDYAATYLPKAFLIAMSAKFVLTAPSRTNFIKTDPFSKISHFERSIFQLLLPIRTYAIPSRLNIFLV
jgi:hypothetical protein